MKNIPQEGTRKQPKIKTEMNGKGLTVHAGLLPVLTFMEKLLFRKRVQEAVRKERGANAQYQIVDAMQMVVVGLIAGATSMVQIVKVWADEVLMKMAGWKEVPVDTTIGRIMKLVTQGDIVELTGIIHRFRGQVWKRAVRSGHKLRSALSDMWIDVDSTVDGVYGNQQGADVGYNPRKKGQKSYHPVIAFVAETKEILHSWFRCGSAYTSNGIVEFMKECMVYMKKRVRVIFRGVSISGIPYQGEIEESDLVARRPEMGGSGRECRVGASRFYVSMCHMESCKTVCGSKEIDQNREGIVKYTRV